LLFACLAQNKVDLSIKELKGLNAYNAPQIKSKIEFEKLLNISWRPGKIYSQDNLRQPNSKILLFILILAK